MLVCLSVILIWR